MPHFNSAGNYTGHYDGSSEWDGHSYDAAGRETTYTDYSSDGYQITNTTTRGFGGDGQMVKESFAATCPSCVPQSPVVAYYIRSSLLGGQVVATVNDQGQRQWSYVYANGELIASRCDAYGYQGAVEWRHGAPSGSSEWRTYPNFGADGITERTEVDPVDADVGTDDPYVGGDGANNGEQNGDLTSRLADASDFSRCNLDGIRMPCPIALKNSDAVESARPSFVTLRFRNQNNPKDVIYRLGALRSLPDGGRGYVPLGARFDEGNYFSVSLAGNALGIGRIHAVSVQSLGSLTGGPQNPTHFRDQYDRCAEQAGGRVPPRSVVATIGLVSEMEGIDPTVLAVTWGSEASPPFSFDSVGHPRHKNGKAIGADVGPGQIANNGPFTKSPWTDGLGDPFGTFTTQRVPFDGNPLDNLRLTARILNSDGGGRAAAGRYHSGTGPFSKTPEGIKAFNDRVKQYDQLQPSYSAFFRCMKQ